MWICFYSCSNDAAIKTADLKEQFVDALKVNKKAEHALPTCSAVLN